MTMQLIRCRVCDRPLAYTRETRRIAMDCPDGPCRFVPPNASRSDHRTILAANLVHSGVKKGVVARVLGIPAGSIARIMKTIETAWRDYR